MEGHPHPPRSKINGPRDQDDDSTHTLPVISIPPFRPIKIAPLPASLLLIATALGSIVLIGIAVITIVPLVVVVGGLSVVLVATLLLGWAGIEAMAAFERWMDNDPRFKR